eukprot:TRINITY_DN6015_c0_g1_i1.p1 TRINITY_DN6015_c0_g1~~TRINITY_DN6015_c0_g1_i1.p1  ORF type:complete len:1479 (+),score=470.57 TRINITY_DN6015_c0_g1_i1:117-4553(+)
MMMVPPSPSELPPTHRGMSPRGLTSSSRGWNVDPASGDTGQPCPDDRLVAAAASFVGCRNTRDLVRPLPEAGSAAAEQLSGQEATSLSFSVGQSPAREVTLSYSPCFGGQGESAQVRRLRSVALRQQMRRPAVAEYAAKAILLPLPAGRDQGGLDPGSPTVGSFDVSELVSFLRRVLTTDAPSAQDIDDGIANARRAAEDGDEYLLRELAARREVTMAARPGFTLQDFDQTMRAKWKMDAWREAELKIIAANERVLLGRVAAKQEQERERERQAAAARKTRSRTSKRKGSLGDSTGARPPDAPSAAVTIKLELGAQPDWDYSFRITCGDQTKSTGPMRGKGRSSDAEDGARRPCEVSLKVDLLEGSTPNEFELTLFEIVFPRKRLCSCILGVKQGPRKVPRGKCSIPADHVLELPDPGARQEVTETVQCTVRGDKAFSADVGASLAVVFSGRQAADAKPDPSTPAPPVYTGDGITTWAHDHNDFLRILVDALPPGDPEQRSDTILSVYATQYGLSREMERLALAQHAVCRAEAGSVHADVSHHHLRAQQLLAPLVRSNLMAAEEDLRRDLLDRILCDVQCRMKHPRHLVAKALAAQASPGVSPAAHTNAARQSLRALTQRLQWIVQSKARLESDAADATGHAVSDGVRKASLCEIPADSDSPGDSSSPGVAGGRRGRRCSVLADVHTAVDFVAEAKKLFSKCVSDAWRMRLAEYRCRVERGDWQKKQQSEDEAAYCETDGPPAALSWDGIKLTAAPKDLAQFVGRRALRADGVRLRPCSDLAELRDSKAEAVRLRFLTPFGLALVCRCVADEQEQLLQREADVFYGSEMKSTDLFPEHDYLAVLAEAGAAEVLDAASDAITAAANSSFSPAGHAAVFSLYGVLRQRVQRSKQATGLGFQQHQLSQHFGKFIREWLTDSTAKVSATFRSWASTGGGDPHEEGNRKTVSPLLAPVSPRMRAQCDSATALLDSVAAITSWVERWLDGWVDPPAVFGAGAAADPEGHGLDGDSAPSQPNTPGPRQGGIGGRRLSTTSPTLQPMKADSPRTRRRASTVTREASRMGRRRSTAGGVFDVLPLQPTVFTQPLSAAGLRLHALQSISAAVANAAKALPAQTSRPDLPAAAWKSLKADASSAALEEAVRTCLGPVVSRAREAAELAELWSGVAVGEGETTRLVPHPIVEEARQEAAEAVARAKEATVDALHSAAQQLSEPVTAAIREALQAAASGRRDDKPPQRGWRGRKEPEPAADGTQWVFRAKLLLESFVAVAGLSAGPVADGPLPTVVLRHVLRCVADAAASKPLDPADNPILTFLSGANTTLSAAVAEPQWEAEIVCLPPEIRAADQRRRAQSGRPLVDPQPKWVELLPAPLRYGDSQASLQQPRSPGLHPATPKLLADEEPRGRTRARRLSVSDASGARGRTGSMRHLRSGSAPGRRAPDRIATGPRSSSVARVESPRKSRHPTRHKDPVKSDAGDDDGFF